MNLRSTTLGCKDIGIRKFEFVAKTQILYHNFDFIYTSKIYSFEKPLKKRM